jgi:hypothetical protein
VPVVAKDTEVFPVFFVKYTQATINPQQEHHIPLANLQAKLDAIFNAHMNAELAGDLDQTLSTMAPNPHLLNVPTMVGGQGPKSVRNFYAKRLIGQFFPPTSSLKPCPALTARNDSLMNSSSCSPTPARLIGCCQE